MGPLTGFKILDLSNCFSGALGTMMMSDLGAEVITITKPDAEPIVAGPTQNGHSVAGAYLTRGKKSVFMDLSDKKQKDIFLKMAESADVIVADCLKNELDDLGIRYEELREKNPKLVLTLITPFGQTGPLCGRAAEETTIQAMSGIMSMVGDFGGEPVRIGTEAAGSAGGYYVFIGSMMAIYGAMNTGKGQIVDISELDAMFSYGEAPVIRYDIADMIPQLCGNRHPSTVPLGDYTCRDGKQVVINVTTDEQFAKFTEALECTELLDGDLKYAAERVNHREEAEKLINEAFAKFDRDVVMERFEKYNIPYGIINDAESITHSEQIEAHHMVATLHCADGTVLKAAATPIKMTGLEEKTEYEIPVAGADTEKVLAEYAN